MRPAGIALVVLTGGAAGAEAQAFLKGVVREDGSARPLAGVEIVIEGSKLSTKTDEAGRFALQAPAGNKVALFRFIGYRPVRMRVFLSKGDTATADAMLVREAAQQLDPIETTANMPRPRGIGVEAFEERRKLGFGQFFDSTALRRYENRRLTDLLRSVTGIKVLYYQEDPRSRPDMFEYRLISTRALGPGGYCYMSILLDGAPLYRSGSRSTPIDFRREFTELGRMHAIEVYRSAAEVPVEYGGSSEECGLIVLWTRPPR